MYEKFIKAIHEKKVLEIVADTDEKGRIRRKVIPFDYGPGKIDGYKDDRYHFYTIDSPDGKHNYSPLPSEVESIEITDEGFNPSDYVKWTPNWIIPRNWGKYS